jgi:hypothetical protein
MIIENQSCVEQWSMSRLPSAQLNDACFARGVVEAPKHGDTIS